MRTSWGLAGMNHDGPEAATFEHRDLGSESLPVQSDDNAMVLHDSGKDVDEQQLKTPLVQIADSSCRYGSKDSRSKACGAPQQFDSSHAHPRDDDHWWQQRSSGTRRRSSSSSSYSRDHSSSPECDSDSESLYQCLRQAIVSAREHQEHQYQQQEHQYQQQEQHQQQQQQQPQKPQQQQQQQQEDAHSGSSFEAGHILLEQLFRCSNSSSHSPSRSQASLVSAAVSTDSRAEAMAAAAAAPVTAESIGSSNTMRGLACAHLPLDAEAFLRSVPGKGFRGFPCPSVTSPSHIGSGNSDDVSTRSPTPPGLVWSGPVCPGSARHYPLAESHPGDCFVCGLSLLAPCTLACGHSACEACLRHLTLTCRPSLKTFANTSTSPGTGERRTARLGQESPEDIAAPSPMDLDMSGPASPSTGTSDPDQGMGSAPPAAAVSVSVSAAMADGEEVGTSCPFPGCTQEIDARALVVSNFLPGLCVGLFPGRVAHAEHARRARLLLERGQYAEAMTSLQQAISKDQGHAETHALLACCHASLGDGERALGEVNVACDLQPTCPHYRVLRAELLRLSSRFADALRDTLLVAALTGQPCDSLLAVFSATFSEWIRASRTSLVSELISQLTPLMKMETPERRSSSCMAVQSAMMTSSPPSSPLPDQQVRLTTSAAVAPAPSSSSPQEEVPPDTRAANCSICLKLLHRPVTTPCGHVFCMDCIMSSLDYCRAGLPATCPLCRQDLSAFYSKVPMAVTEQVERLLLHFHSEAYLARQAEHEQLRGDVLRPMGTERAELNIFICTLVCPGRIVKLHVFEPRYRVMMRRVLDSGRQQFGMCTRNAATAPGQLDGYTDFGTVLDIKEHHRYGNGRYDIHCIATRRFRVLRRFMQSGYDRAEVEWIRDIPPSESEMDELVALHNQVRRQANQFFNDPRIQQLRRYLGEFPAPPLGDEETRAALQSADGPDWLWYCVHNLPVGVDANAILRTVSSPRLAERLRRVQTFLAQPAAVTAYCFLVYRQATHQGL